MNSKKMKGTADGMTASLVTLGMPLHIQAEILTFHLVFMTKYAKIRDNTQEKPLTPRPLFSQGRTLLVACIAMSFCTYAAAASGWFFFAAVQHAIFILLHKLEAMHPSHSMPDQEHLRRCADSAALNFTTLAVAKGLASDFLRPYLVVILLSVQGYHWLLGGPGVMSATVAGEGGEETVRNIYLTAIGALLIGRAVLPLWFLELGMVESGTDFIFVFSCGFLAMQATCNRAWNRSLGFVRRVIFILLNPYLAHRCSCIV